MAEARRRSYWRKSGGRRLLVAGLSVAGHAAVIFVLLSAQPTPPRFADVEAVSVALVAPPPPPAPPEPPAQSPSPPAPTPPTPVTPPPPKLNVHRTPAPPRDVAPLEAEAGPTAESDEPSDAELASATTAENGGGAGRACNMAGWLQAKLRKDPNVQAAMAQAATSQGGRGKPLRVWNGDWVRHTGQEGAGLATVREALMWEVAFAPQACRAEPVHGLVLLSLNDSPGAARVALGSGEWRWSDLLFSRGGGVSRR